MGYGKWQSVLGNGGQPVSSLQPAFVAQVSSATDYHPFGMPMSGRSYGDSVKRCVPVSWQVWLEEGRWGFLKGIDGLSGGGNGSGSGGSTGKKVGAKTRRYGTEAGSEDSLGYLGGGVCFGDEVLQVYHTRERSSSDPVVETYNTEADGDRGGVVQTVGYKVDLTGEPQGGVRLFLRIPLDSVGDRQSVQLKYRMGGLGNSLEEDVVAQVRVRQYRSSGGSDYETALGWRNVEGNGEQVLDIPVDSYRVAGKGRTYVEWRFARRGGGSGVFVDKGIDLRNVRMEELKVGWYTKTVYSCEEEDNYRFGYNTQEKVNEVSGKGNHYTAPYWEYDPRTGRRWNLDPVADEMPDESPYATNHGNPVLNKDPDGKFGVPGAVIGAGIGVLIGGGSSLAKSVLEHGWKSLKESNTWKKAGANALGGAVVGGTAGLTAGISALSTGTTLLIGAGTSAAAGFGTSLSEDAIDGKELDYGKAAKNGILSGVTYGVAGKAAQAFKSFAQNAWWSRGNAGYIWRTLTNNPRLAGQAANGVVKATGGMIKGQTMKAMYPKEGSQEAPKARKASVTIEKLEVIKVETAK